MINDEEGREGKQNQKGLERREWRKFVKNNNAAGAEKTRGCGEGNK